MKENVPWKRAIDVLVVPDGGQVVKHELIHDSWQEREGRVEDEKTETLRSYLESLNH